MVNNTEYSSVILKLLFISVAMSFLGSCAVVNVAQYPQWHSETRNFACCYSDIRKGSVHASIPYAFYLNVYHGKYELEMYAPTEDIDFAFADSVIFSIESTGNELIYKGEELFKHDLETVDNGKRLRILTPSRIVIPKEFNDQKLHLNVSFVLVNKDAIRFKREYKMELRNSDKKGVFECYQFHG